MADKTKTTAVPIRLDADMADIIRRLSEVSGIGMQEIIRRCVRYTISHAKSADSLDFLLNDEQALRQILRDATPPERDANPFSFRLNEDEATYGPDRKPR